MTGWRSRYRSSAEGDDAIARPSGWMTAAIIITIVLAFALLLVMAVWAKGWAQNPS
jgi:hypothetical protein